MYKDPQEIAFNLVHQITIVAQLAESTLHVTGGALELSKWVWFALMWQWDAKVRAYLYLVHRHLWM